MKKGVMIAVASLALLGGAAAGWADSVRADTVTAASSTDADVVTQYQQALDQACGMRLEPGPEAYRLYERAHQAAPWLPDPGMAADQCFQREAE